MKRTIALLGLSVCLLLWIIPLYAQEATAEATPPVIPEVTTTEALQEAIAIGQEVGESSGFFKGAGLGALVTAASLSLLFTLVMRSTVAQTFLEGLIYKRLDKAGIKRLHDAGATIEEFGNVIKKVTDGLPNDNPANTKPTL